VFTGLFEGEYVDSLREGNVRMLNNRNIEKVQDNLPPEYYDKPIDFVFDVTQLAASVRIKVDWLGLWYWIGQ
jgi:hypothetical protein